MREILSHRNAIYNRQLEMVERMEEEGRILVIRPMKPMVVGRIEKDVKKLAALYDEGYACAKTVMESEEAASFMKSVSILSDKVL